MKPKIERIVDFQVKRLEVQRKADREWEAQRAAERASRECQEEEVQRLGHFAVDGRIDIGYIQKMPYVPGNQFVEGGHETPPDLAA